VQPILPAIPLPAARQNLGIWVVFPEPVSPDMITTWFFEMASIMSSFLSVIGKDSVKTGYKKTWAGFVSAIFFS